MRKLRTAADLSAAGWTVGRLRRELREQRITRIVKGVYGEGGDPPSELDVMRATALVTNGVCDAVLTAHMLDVDGVRRWRPKVLVSAGTAAKREWVRRVSVLPAATVEIGQVACLPAADMLWELALVLDDVHWEQALEFCLRRRLVSLEEIDAWMQRETEASRRVKRVIKARGGLFVAATESLLETLAVQLIRTDPSIPTPTRQYAIYDEHGNFVGRPDLCWPELGVFLELDGQGHRGQPVYDAVRQTRIAIKTRWLCGRLTWEQCTTFLKPRVEISPR
ncbi:MAG TPA: hypothetical protein VMZ22_00060 [Acidimicrobiales bacterium]|nr:hypothetical protein [Acidimicrobiales bacterium]